MKFTMPWRKKPAPPVPNPQRVPAAAAAKAKLKPMLTRYVSRRNEAGEIRRLVQAIGEDDLYVRLDDGRVFHVWYSSFDFQLHVDQIKIQE